MTCSLSTGKTPWSRDIRHKYIGLYGDDTEGEDPIVMRGTNMKGSTTKKSYK